MSSFLVSRNIKPDDGLKKIIRLRKEQILVSKTTRQNLSSIQHKFENIFPAIEHQETKIVIKKPSANIGGRSPLVLMFGWGGASHKNLAKYSALYVPGRGMHHNTVSLAHSYPI